MTGLFPSYRVTDVLSRLPDDTDQNRVRKVIYTHISKWANEEVAVGHGPPMFRNGKKVHPQSPPTIWSGVPEVDRILDAAVLESKTDLASRIARIDRLVKALTDSLSAIAEFSTQERADMMVAPLYRAGIPERVVDAIGAPLALEVSVSHLLQRLNASKLDTEKRLTAFENKKGRPRNAAVHGVAKELAVLYARVTGTCPTYSENENGLHGKYTPALRDVLNALGWSDASLRKPALDAVRFVKDNLSEVLRQSDRLGLFEAIMTSAIR